MATKGNKWQLSGIVRAAHWQRPGRLWLLEGSKWQRNGS